VLSASLTVAAMGVVGRPTSVLSARPSSKKALFEGRCRCPPKARRVIRQPHPDKGFAIRRFRKIAINDWLARLKRELCRILR